MGKPKVAAIIQARMGSSRFPGKVLKELAGKPILWHIVHRLRKCSTVDVIAVATSINSVDDPLVEFCKEQNVLCIRGSEDNVLDRYRQAAEELLADIIVRVTGDAPLVDPVIIDGLVKKLVSEAAEYCTGDPETPSIHEGFSPFSREALERLAREAPEDPVAIEHVTAYFKEHPDKFHTAYVRIPEAHNFTGTRISIDTPADLEFLEHIYQRLQVSAGEADVADVVKLLKTSSELLDINSRIRQKSAMERTRKAVIRCDGDADVGLGHVVRCLALAEELRDIHSWGVTFAVERGEIGIGIIAEAAFDVRVKAKADAEDRWLENLLASLKPDALILDIRTDLDREKIGGLKKFGPLIVDIDDPSERRLEADMVFYPPVPQIEKMNWSGYKGTLFTGWEWVVLRRQFACPPGASNRSSREPPVILVTMGGSDPAGMTLKTAVALNAIKVPFKAVFAIGSAYEGTGKLRDLLKSVAYQYEIKSDVKDMAALMAGVDLAVGSFGVTAYELAAVGVPGIYLCLTEDHRIGAEFFEKSGMGINLGLYSDVSESEISGKVEALLKDPGLRGKMASVGKSRIDGMGAGRIAKLITKEIAERSGDL